jgi:hypothetical protein
MRSLSFVLLALVAGFASGDKAAKDGYVPEEGFVPNKDVAIKIAVAVWEPIYGADKIAKQKPFRATIADGVWTVEGSLPKGMKGGVALAEVSKEDGRIIRVSHGK